MRSSQTCHSSPDDRDRLRPGRVGLLHGWKRMYLSGKRKRDEISRGKIKDRYIKSTETALGFVIKGRKDGIWGYENSSAPRYESQAYNPRSSSSGSPTTLIAVYVSFGKSTYFLQVPSPNRFVTKIGPECNSPSTKIRLLIASRYWFFGISIRIISQIFPTYPHLGGSSQWFCASNMIIRPAEQQLKLNWFFKDPLQYFIGLVRSIRPNHCEILCILYHMHTAT